MDKDNQFSFTQANIDFGKTTDTPQFNYALALDMDKKVIRIPYSSPFIPIEQLINNYLAVTSHRKAFKKQPCLRILQGKKKMNVADPKIELITFGLNLKEVCFRVQDTAFPNPNLSDITNFLSGESTLIGNDEKSILTISFEGKKIVHTIKNKKTIRDLKQQLCKMVQKQRKISVEMLSLQLDGSLLKDNQTIQHYGLDNRQLRMMVQKKQGCYRSNTMILNSDGNYVEIKSLKVGDKIKIVNRDTFQLQNSCVISVYQTLIDECIKVKLKNGVEIYTTPNHLFLCEDGIFRMVKSTNPKEICLKEHDYLRLKSLKTVEIQDIRSKVLNEIFYNVVTEHGHTVVIQDVISHHFAIKVQSTEKIVHSIDASPFDTILKIKQKVQILFAICLNNQKLSCFSKQLNDSQTISDKNLNNETVINLTKKSCEDWFNAIYSDSLVVCKDGALTKLAELVVQSSQISYFDFKSNKISHQCGAFYGIAPVKIDEYLSISLDKSQIKVATDSYFLLQNDSVILGLDLYKIYQNKQPLPILKTINGHRPIIGKIQLIKQKTNFHRIKTNTPNFLTSGVVLVKEILHIIVRKSGKKVGKLCLCVTKDLTIREIKQRVAILTNIDFKNQFLSFNGSYLDNMQTLSKKNIGSQNVLTIDNCQKIHQSSILLNQQFDIENQDKNLTIQYEKESIVVKYATVADFTVKEVLKGYLKFDEISAYVLVFAGLIVYSNQRIKKIEEDPQFSQDHISAIVIKNQKLSFLQIANLSTQSIKTFSSIIFESKEQFSSLPQKSSIQVKLPNLLLEKLKKTQQSLLASNLNNLFKKEYFYLPFLLLTSRHFNQQIYRSIRKFDDYKEQALKETSVFSIIRALYCNLNWLQNYLKICYYGLRNFKASLFFKPGHTFYHYNFTLAYKQQGNIIEQLKNNSGTLFYIQSTSGKQISIFSMYPQKNQILFAPFTYFLVERVKPGQEYDEVWLTQISSPITFRKDIILWVDDNPQNNAQQFDYFLHLKKNIEILQVTSTKAAQNWIKEFGWILSWKGLKFKLISDMGRWQWKGQSRVENKEAGIDLLQLLYNIRGYSSRTLIFCGNQKKAKQLAVGRKIPEQRYQIATQLGQLQSYVEINP